MKNFSILRKYPFWLLGLLLLCSCDLAQELIQPPGEMEPVPIRVTMIYPNDCVGDSGYCDTLHFGVTRGRGRAWDSPHRDSRKGERSGIDRNVVQRGGSTF